jgi:hypothetical protein
MHGITTPDPELPTRGVSGKIVHGFPTYVLNFEKEINLLKPRMMFF